MFYWLEPSFEEKDYKWIVLRVLAENFSKWGEGFDLFCINDQGIELLKLQICPDKENRLNCLHENISNIDYALFKELVYYTFDNKECVLQCGPSKIKNIIKDLSNEEFTSFINYYCDYQASKDGKPKPNKFINRIKNAYFESRIDECPEYVG